MKRLFYILIQAIVLACIIFITYSGYKRRYPPLMILGGIFIGILFTSISYELKEIEKERRERDNSVRKGRRDL